MGDWASALATNIDVPAMALRPSAAACSSVCPAPSIAWAVAAVAMATSFCHPSWNTGCDSANPTSRPSPSRWMTRCARPCGSRRTAEACLSLRFFFTARLARVDASTASQRISSQTAPR